MKAAEGYTRLPGRGRFVSLARPSLWLGSDDLLLLTRMMGTEEYRRFSYRDIQAVIIRRTPARLRWNLGLIMLAVTVATPAAWSLARGGQLGAAGVFPSVLLLISLFFMVCALVNTVRGPTCACHVRTAVQTETLASLNRLRQAQRALKAIRPRIQSAQEGLGDVELSTVGWHFDGAATVLPHRPLRNTEAASAPVSGRAHLALFSLLMGDGFITVMHVGQQWLLLEALALATMLAGFIAAVVALARQREGSFPSGLRRLTWTALAYYALMVGVGMVYGIIYSIRHLGATVVSTTAFYGEAGFKEIVFISAMVAILLGALGIILLYRSGLLARGTANVPAST